MPGAAASSLCSARKRRERLQLGRADMRFGKRALVEEAVGDLGGGAAGALGMAVRGKALLDERHQRGAVVAIGDGADFGVEAHVLAARAAPRGGRD